MSTTDVVCPSYALDLLKGGAWPTENKRQKPRVVLVDDEEAILRLMSQFLRPKFEIVATASNGREAVSIVLQSEPDIVVLDIGVPVMHGLDVIALLNQKKVATKVVFLSTFADRQLYTAAAAAGARAFVFKSQMYTDLPRAMEAVLAGQMFVSSEEKR
jgi:DNA-binding NarL/FixJ family response regulator